MDGVEKNPFSDLIHMLESRFRRQTDALNQTLKQLEAARKSELEWRQRELPLESTRKISGK